MQLQNASFMPGRVVPVVSVLKVLVFYCLQQTQTEDHELLKRYLNYVNPKLFLLFDVYIVHSKSNLARLKYCCKGPWFRRNFWNKELFVMRAFDVCVIALALCLYLEILRCSETYIYLFKKLCQSNPLAYLVLNLISYC